MILVTLSGVIFVNIIDKLIDQVDLFFTELGLIQVNANTVIVLHMNLVVLK